MQSRTATRVGTLPFRASCTKVSADQIVVRGMNARSRVEDLKPLTSLRFFAAFAIVLLHAKLYTKWGWLQPIQIPLVQGVSFFFVLSGFILTHVYSARRGIGYWDFVRLRIARLWPVHLVTLLLVVLFVRPASFDGDGFFDNRLTLLANISLAQSMFPFLSYLFSWNSVSWSISTEMCFYLCFPLLLVGIARSWPLNLLISFLLAVGLFGVLQLAGVPLVSDDLNKVTVSAATYANPLTRGFEFCLGMASWVLWDRHIRGVKAGVIAWTIVEVAVLAGAWLWLAVLFAPAAARFPLASLSLWVSSSGSCWVFAILIVTFAGGHGAMGRFLSTTLFVWLGEISFAIYMVHQILFKILNWNLGIGSELVFFPILVLVSAALHHLIERPGRAFLSGQLFPPRLQLSAEPRRLRRF
jgi:peptidoglycan/LPS O-acetylase OafA/YrhL